MVKYIFNPRYVLRHENEKSLILMKPDYLTANKIHVIHPVYAMMLSFFNGTSIDEAVDGIVKYFNVSKENVKKTITLLINNENMVSGTKGVFPPKTIIEYDKSMPKHNYRTEQFLYNEINLVLDRLKVPSDIICNITMKCATDCFYCYADRKNNITKELSIEMIYKILDDARNIGVVSFKIMGGDIFVYKDWYKLLQKLHECDYSPCISTKIPFGERHIEAIKKFNIDKYPIQISLDTLIKEHLYDILNVHGSYIDKLLKTFELLEKYEIKYLINTVISKKNDSIEDIKSLENFLVNKKFLVEWDLNPAKCSMYLRKPYSAYKPSIENIRKINEYLRDKISKGSYNFKVNLPGIITDKNKLSIEEKKEKFKKRNPCSANLSALYILPDGKVTICEELYWHPNFILGDLATQSLTEIWNSQKAKELFYQDQSKIRKESYCSKCEDFVSCRKYLHVCWRDIILAYGNENWDYPDIHCPYAPKVTRNISM